ncbi:MAG: LCP family protein [Eubacteriales bacterium]
MSNKLKKLSKSQKKAIAVVSGIVLFLLLITLCIIAVFSHYLGKINRSDNSGPTIPPEHEDFETDTPIFDETSSLLNDPSNQTSAPSDFAADTTLDPDSIEWAAGEALADDDLINIMLVGQDRRPGEGRTRSDVMILCSINPKTKEVSLISFLRDLYVQIPGGYSDNRLNVAYAFGGFPLLYETMYVNFGITIDGGLEVDFEGFTDIIDLLGGVDVELSAAEANIVGGGAVAGMNHLNGTQALNYARIRSLDNDFNRTGRQRLILESVFNKFRTSDLQTMLAFLDAALPLLTTDMDNSELVSLAVILAPMASSLELSNYMVPTYECYTFASIRGMSVLLPDLDRIRDLLKTEYLPLA